MTGAGRGLGRSHALALAAEGASVLVSDLDGDAARAVVEEIEAAGGTARADVRALATVADGRAVVDAALEAWGRVDVVVNNAGVSMPTGVDALDDEQLDRHLGVHLRATVGTTAGAFPRMREQGEGRIVNTVSGHAFDPRAPGSAAYAAAKAGIFGFTRAAAHEGAGHGVAVNALAPLAFTDMSSEYLSRVDGAEERFAPEHASRVVVWLATDAPIELTGRVIRAEGDRIGEYRVELGEMVEFERIEELFT